MTLPVQPTPTWTPAASAGWAASVLFRETALADLGDALLAAADLRAGERVLEIGSGAGGLACRMAEAVGPIGSVVGIDISPELNAIATRRAAGIGHLRFETADAQTVALPDAPFDRLVSRLGIMFFADAAAALAHLRALLRPGARLDVAVWDAIALNPWADVVLAVCRRHLPLPPRQPRPTGAFAFSELPHFGHVLETAGFADVACRAWRRDLPMGGPGEPLHAVARQLLPPGVVTTVFLQAPPHVQAALIDDLALALEPFASAAGVRMPAAVHLVSAAVPHFNSARRKPMRRFQSGSFSAATSRSTTIS